MALRAWRRWLAGASIAALVLGGVCTIASCLTHIYWVNPSGFMANASNGSISWVEWTPAGSSRTAVVNGPPAGLSVGAVSGNMTITAATITVGTWHGVLWKWPLVVAAILGLSALWFWFQEWKRKRIGGLCVHCGYDARGLKVCPECGREVASAAGALRSNG